jgi:CRP/FNR family cyclic AMP-dependent transcriptional regulator
MAMAEAIVPIQILHRIPMFKQLTHGELQELDHLVRQRQFRKKSIIFSEGDEQKAIYFIQSGLIKTYETDYQGHEHITAYLKADDMLPPDGLFDTRVYPVTAECIVQTTIFVLPVRTLEHFLLSNPGIAVKIMRAMNDQINDFQRKQKQFKEQGYEHHGQMFLLKLAEHYGTTRKRELRIGIPMTHQYLAHTIGSTREGATLFVNQLRKEGIVDMSRDGFVIHDVDSLKRWKEN